MVGGVESRMLRSTRARGFLPTVGSSLLVAASLTGLAFAPSDPDRPASVAPPQKPTVEAVEPAGNSVPTNAAIVLRFTQPMAHDGVFFFIQPQVGGTFSWPDDYTLQYQPIGLAHSTTYSFRIYGRSQVSQLLEGQREWQFTTSPAAAATLAPGPRFARIPILVYHYIRNNPDPRDSLGFSLSVTPANFAAQMDWLAQNGYHPVAPKDLVAYLRGERGLPSRPIVITFDDGYADFYTTAIPILRAHDFTAVSYVVSGFMGRGGYMTASQVLSAQGAGFEIGGHTVDHVNLTTQSVDGLRYQLLASKEALERLLKRPVTSFCYPYGKFGSREANAVAAAGYQDATTTQGGSYRTIANQFVWPRLYVTGGETLGQFAYTVRRDS
jgi:peptidoglycan/xylan/chitin deacetylase (PgdA/CDA1 family)